MREKFIKISIGKDGKVSFNKDRVQDSDEKGNALPITYQPCSLLAQ